MAACKEESRNRTPSPMSIRNRCHMVSNFGWKSVCKDATTICPNSNVDDLWIKIREEALFEAKKEPILAKYFCTVVLTHTSLESAIAKLLSSMLSTTDLVSGTLFDVMLTVFDQDEDLIRAVRDDLRAVKDRDPACVNYVHCLLNFKGFQALQAHRVAHSLWNGNRKTLALMIQSRISQVFGVDIHPGASIGRGVMIDHATGVVIGETAVVGDNVTLLHGVTLGGTGKVAGDRHPKIGNGVLIGAGSKVLGNVKIGDGAKIGAGSIVLKDVAARITVVGSPARPVEKKSNTSHLL